MKYKARVLPDTITGSMEEPVPLIIEHQIYGKCIGEVYNFKDGFATIETNDPRVKIGTKLSAGSFVIEDTHEIREVSITRSPKFPECQIIEVIEP